MPETPYVGPILDGHFHIWRLADLPWLQAPPSLKIFGNSYSSMRRDYSIDEYLTDFADQKLQAAIFVQANWPEEKSFEEVAWVQEVADAHGFPIAMVGYVDLGAADREARIDRQMSLRTLRGVRQQIFWHPTIAEYRCGSRPDLLRDKFWRSGIQLLAERGLVFELQIFPQQMNDAASVLEEYPNAQIVLVHAGMPEDTSESGWDRWRSGMERLAKFDNIAVKLSGIGTFVRRVDPALTRKCYGETARIFGAHRCLFGSNFPVEKNWTALPPLVATVKGALDDLTQQAQADIFYNNARRIYRI